MTPKVIRLAFAALIGFAPMAMAQQADTTQKADTTQSGTSTLSTGTAVNPAGSTYSRQAFTDWELRCVRTEDGKETEMDPCQLYQLLKDAKGNSVAEISLFALPKKEGDAIAAATIITPLETLLTQGMTMVVDNAAPKRYPFSWCSVVGCYARVGFTQAEIDSFQKGSKAEVIIFPVAAPKTDVKLTMSLSGFTAGYQAVHDANKKAAELTDAAKKAAPQKDAPKTAAPKK